MEQIPFVEDKPIYKQLAEKARFANLTPEEQELYELDRRNEMAYMHSLLYAKMEAEEKGRAEGEAKGFAIGEAKGRAEGLAEGESKAYQEKLESARSLKQMGLSSEQIHIALNLPITEIDKLY